MTTSLSPDLLKLVAPGLYLQNTLSESRLTSARPLVVRAEILTDDPSSVLVRLGNTSVLVGCKLSTAQAVQGVLDVSVISPFGWTKRDQLSLSGLLHATLSPSIDFASLQIPGRSGPAVWHVELGFVILEDDGSVFDACVAAGISALRRLQLPGLDANLLADASLSETSSVRLLATPLTLTFRRVNGRLVPDCSKLEESVASGNFVVKLASDGLVSVADWQGVAQPEELEAMLAAGKAVLAQRLQTLERAL